MGSAARSPACPRDALIDDLAQQALIGPGEEFDLDDELGATHCTRDNSSGEPIAL